jgi:hypothetical protein
MTPLKLGLRIWIALTSIVSFLGGWALLSHAAKPASLFPENTGAQPSTISADSQGVVVPSLAPIPSLDSLVANNSTSTTTTNIQPLFSAPSVATSNLPRMRTRGS